MKGNLGHVVEIDVGRNLYSDGDGDSNGSNSNALTTMLISSPVPAKLQREKTKFLSLLHSYSLNLMRLCFSLRVGSRVRVREKFCWRSSRLALSVSNSPLGHQEKPKWRTKVLTRQSYVDSLTPSSLSNVVFCAPFTLYPVLKSVRYSQNCLEGAGGEGH